MDASHAFIVGTIVTPPIVDREGGKYPMVYVTVMTVLETTSKRTGKTRVNKTRHRCFAIGSIVDKIEKFKRGQRVIVSGQIEECHYKDKGTGILIEDKQILVKDWQNVGATTLARASYEAATDLEPVVDDVLPEAEYAGSTGPVGGRRILHKQARKAPASSPAKA